MDGTINFTSGMQPMLDMMERGEEFLTSNRDILADFSERDFPIRRTVPNGYPARNYGILGYQRILMHPLKKTVRFQEHPEVWTQQVRMKKLTILFFFNG